MIETRTEIALAEPGVLRDVLVRHLAEHDVALDRHEDVVHARMEKGEARIGMSGSGLRIEARAGDRTSLGQIAAFLASHVREFAPPGLPAILWEGLAGTWPLPDFREMTVLRTADLSPHMRRVTLTGTDLARFASTDDIHVRLYVPQGEVEPVWPAMTADGRIAEADPARAPAMRKYTIRRIDPARAEVDIDFVLHDILGPGSDWARRAVAGMRIGMAGPGGRTARAADWMLLAGDETALPAIARRVEELPGATRGVVLIETTHRSGHIPIQAPNGMVTRWLHRDEGAPSLADAVRQVSIPDETSRFCWAGAELSSIQSIRSHWRNVCGLRKDEQLAVAYWRLGMAESR